ncbi:MAG: prepilin-type N-terminal cleavage/methylation domain-containing protein, partial [Tepidisphaerales bacterium]
MTRRNGLRGGGVVKGFTLVELLVVIGIIALLISI